MTNENQDPRSDAAPDLPPSTPDDAELGYNRLRAADPAGSITPDSAELRAMVRERLAPVAATAPVGPRARPTLRWMKVAAATAAVLAVGVGGFAIGQTRSGGGESVALTTEAPASAVDSAAPSAARPAAGPPGSDSDPTASPGAVVSEGTASPAIGLGAGQGADQPGGSKVAAADSARSSSLAWSRTVFIDGGVTGEAGTAAAWALDAGQVVSAETAARLAAALGVGGEPRQEYGAWMVGPTDGTGPTLSLGGDGSASLSYYNPTVDAYYCPQPVVAQTAEVAPTDGAGVDPVPLPTECAQRDVGIAPQGEEAIAKAKDVLTLVGLDPATFNYEAGAPDEMNNGYGWVSAYSVLNGQRTGVTWQIAFSGPELSSVSGSLAPLVAAGDYPIISAADAVQRLSDPRFGAGGGVYPLDYVGPVGDPSADPSEVSIAPLPAPGSPISWPVSEVTITSAQLGLAMQYQSDGSVLLLPTYSLSDAAGVSWSVVAVADSGLNFAG